MTSRRRKLLAAVGVIGAFAFGLSLALSTSALSFVTGTTTQSNGTLVTGTGNFAYDGQTVPTTSWPNMGNAENNKLQWIKTPFTFDCANGTLKVSDKKEFTNETNTYTFKVGAGSDPVVPAGSVIVGVLVHSGVDFDFTQAVWVSDGSLVTITLSKGYSNAAVFYCTPVPPVTTTSGTTTNQTTSTGTTTVGTTTQVSTTVITQTVTTGGGTTTLRTTTTVPGSTTTVQLPGSQGPTVTQTVTNTNTVTNTVTKTVPGAQSTSTVTVPGKPKTTIVIKRVPGKPKVVTKTITKTKTKIVKVPAKPLQVPPNLAHTK